MGKNILFYSNYCKYSKQVIQQISSSNIKDNLIYVCVDDDNIKLPEFISAVPTIYLVNEKKIIIDDEIQNYIGEQGNLNNSSNSNNSNNSNNSDDSGELQAYFGECNSCFGNSYCNIDNSENKPYISNFTFLDSTETDSNSNNSKMKPPRNSLDSKLQELQQNRDSIQQISRR
jgi:hypothetical protein